MARIKEEAPNNNVMIRSEVDSTGAAGHATSIDERNATSVGTAAAAAAATGAAAALKISATGTQTMIRPFPSAKKKTIPAASWPIINRNQAQKQISSANFWPISRFMKTHPTCWNPTAAIRLKTYIAAAAAAAANAEALFRQPQQLTAVTGGRKKWSAVHDMSGAGSASVQQSNKRRKQSKPVRICSDARTRL